jgi:hypothetical protein
LAGKRRNNATKACQNVGRGRFIDFGILKNTNLEISQVTESSSKDYLYFKNTYLNLKNNIEGIVQNNNKMDFIFVLVKRKENIRKNVKSLKKTFERKMFKHI